MQQIESHNDADIADLSKVPSTGRIIAFDLGTKRVGLAVCDESQVLARPVRTIERGSWKKFLQNIKDIARDFDAVAVVFGLPYSSEGGESEMTADARHVVKNLRLSIALPVFFQDERFTSYEAKGRLWNAGLSQQEMLRRVDSEAARIILSDFLDRLISSR